MANAVGISPPAMINRIVHREATPTGAELARVAVLAQKVRTAIENSADPKTTDQPDPKPIVVSSGADVDRLV
ncbi:hypothetical protein PSQ90_09820 [Devosia rhodophyticola]|uniref:XRE family transcriptional regulator n=1 Tax=Devosia rhodophyticola TaxID=3026423 RepID=A0ABY7YTV7_9HYPH|nr:hypothetical protein [Devosia rhodophyticola]WDR04627.1 hypothetical protein PSQ90_09820 [Devosia rhodophyticola]